MIGFVLIDSETTAPGLSRPSPPVLAVATPALPKPVTIIKARSGWQAVNVRQLWAYRELLYFLVWRDIKVRYKQTVLGAAWAIIQPVMTMLVLHFFLAAWAA